MFSREEVKAITDKVIDMAKADAVEVEFNGGERSATRFANSNITANMVQFDRTVSLTIHLGNKSGTATVRDFDDATLKQAVADAQKRAEEARESTEPRPSCSGRRTTSRSTRRCRAASTTARPSARRRYARASTSASKKGVLGSGYIPKVASDDLLRQLQGTLRLLPVRRSELHPHGAARKTAPARAGQALPGSRTRA